MAFSGSVLMCVCVHVCKCTLTQKPLDVSSIATLGRRTVQDKCWSPFYLRSKVKVQGHMPNKCNVATVATTNKHSPCTGCRSERNFTVTTFEIKRSNVKVGVNLHSSKCQSYSLTLWDDGCATITPESTPLQYSHTFVLYQWQWLSTSNGTQHVYSDEQIT